MEKIKRNRLIRQVSLALLLTMAIFQVSTVILLETGFRGFDVGELHEFCGFTLFGLIAIHIVVFRKSLKAIFFPKTK
jgi:FtsH-binding integral membrane protein